MNILLDLKFIAFLIYCCLLVLVLWKDPRSALNRVCATFLASCIVWVFTDFFILNNNTSEGTAVLFNNIGSIGWIGGVSFFLWLVLVFSEKKKILKSKFIFPLLFIPPALLIYIQCTGLLTILIKESFGWLAILSNSIWSSLFILYYISFLTVAIYLLVKFKNKTKELKRKKQAGIFLVTMLIPIVFGFLTDALLPNMNIHSLPPIMNLILLIWAAGLVYAINKYKLMTITPALAAENIISTMADSLILLDNLGNIITANKAALDLLECRKDELLGKSVEVLFTEKDFKDTLLDRALKGETIRNYELGFKIKRGESVPVIFSSSTILDETGSVAGIVCIAKDITERKKADAERERLITELQSAIAEIKVLNGLLPICSNCKKIRDDKGYWNQLEGYIQEHSQARFSHGMCPECAEKYFGPVYTKYKEQKDAASKKPLPPDSPKEKK